VSTQPALPLTNENWPAILRQTESQESLAKAIGAYCDEAVKVNIEVTTDSLVTPTLLIEKAAREAQENAELSIQNDPLLAELLSRVDGEVNQKSVRPVSTHEKTMTTNGENS